MSKVIPGASLTAYERWELPSVDTAAGENDFTPPPAVKSPPPALPTLEDIESIQRMAQEEGFSAGYQEGRKEGKEQGHGKGYQEGHEKGFQQGYQEGLAAGQAAAAEHARHLAEIVDFMSRPMDNLDTAVEQELAQLTVAIARQLIRRELKTSPGEIVAVVRQAVGMLPSASQEVRVRLHPEDAALVREIWSLNDANRSLRIQDDPALTRGGCRVETDISSIDATLERRLGNVIAAVLGNERKGESHGS